MEAGKTCCGCFHEEDATLQQHGSYVTYPGRQNYDSRHYETSFAFLPSPEIITTF